MEQLLSQKMCQELVKIDTISFDGTFYACPKQFMQLWTIFGIFLQHTLLAIYCLLTSKIEKLFKVNVVKVNIINQKSKLKIKQGKKSIKSGYKKAIITLKKGQSIDLTTGI